MKIYSEPRNRHWKGKEFEIWDITTDVGEPCCVCMLSFSRDSSFDSLTGKPKILLSPDGRYCASSLDDSFEVGRFPSGHVLKETLVTSGGSFWKNICFSANSSRVLADGHVWDLELEQRIGYWPRTSEAISPSGTYIAGSEVRKCRLFSVDERIQIREKEVGWSVSDVALPSDTEWLLCGAREDDAIVFNAMENVEIARYPKVDSHDGMLLSPLGKFLVTFGKRKYIIWRVGASPIHMGVRNWSAPVLITTFGSDEGILAVHCDRFALIIDTWSEEVLLEWAPDYRAPGDQPDRHFAGVSFLPPGFI